VSQSFSANKALLNAKTSINNKIVRRPRTCIRRYFLDWIHCWGICRNFRTEFRTCWNALPLEGGLNTNDTDVRNNLDDRVRLGEMVATVATAVIGARSMLFEPDLRLGTLDINPESAQSCGLRIL
jgi:hypothetical protein